LAHTTKRIAGMIVVMSLLLSHFTFGCSKGTALDQGNNGQAGYVLKDGSPVRIVQHTNSAPRDIDQQELAALGESQFVIGIDDHGYGMVDGDTAPASHTGFSKAYPNVPHIGFYGGTDMYQVWCEDERFRVGDLHEDVFFHTTDPASLNIIQTGGGLQFYFVADDRADPANHVQYCAYKNLYQVIDHVVESADSELGTFTTVNGLTYAADPNADGSILTATCGGCSASKYYRVRSLLQEASGTRLIEYSWPQKPIVPTGPVFAWGYTNDQRTFDALVYAPDGNLPADAKVLVEQPGLLDAGMNGLVQTVGTASSHSSPQTNFGLYHGALSLSTDSFRWSWTYRFKTGTTSLPAGRDTYSMWGSRRNNNRGMTQFTGQAVKPFHTVQKDLILNRLQVLIKNGALGSYLDFYHDNIHGCVSICYDPDGCDMICSYQDNRAWTSEKEENDHGFYMHEQAAAALAYWKKELPGVFLAHGYHMVTNQARANEWYYPHSDGSHVEFFAFDHLDNPILERIPNGLFEELIKEGHQGNRKYILMSHFAQNYTTDFSTGAKRFQRETSLGAYLLVAHMNVYFGSVVHNNYLQVAYFPEWRVPLGKPAQLALGQYSDLWVKKTDDYLLMRRFENGLVVFNNTLGRRDIPEAPKGLVQTFDLPGPMQRMRISGGYDPILHDPSQNRIGNGQITYDAATSTVTLAPGEAAIFLVGPGGL